MVALETSNTWLVYICKWSLFVDVATCVVGVQGVLQVDSRTEKLYYRNAQQYCIDLQIVKSSLAKGGYTLVTLPRIVTPYRDSVDGTRDSVTYQKLVTR